MDERNETVFVNTEIEGGSPAAEDELSRLYQELGKAYYEGAFEDPLPQLLPLFDEITKIVKKQEEEQACMEESFGEMGQPPQEREHKYCGSCGAELPASAKFCGICGTPVEGGR